jgi:hypothetical protein
MLIAMSNLSKLSGQKCVNDPARVLLEVRPAVLRGPQFCPHVFGRLRLTTDRHARIKKIPPAHTMTGVLSNSSSHFDTLCGIQAFRSTNGKYFPIPSIRTGIVRAKPIQNFLLKDLISPASSSSALIVFGSSGIPQIGQSPDNPVAPANASDRCKSCPCRNRLKRHAAFGTVSWLIGKRSQDASGRCTSLRFSRVAAWQGDFEYGLFTRRFAEIECALMQSHNLPTNA